METFQDKLWNSAQVAQYLDVAVSTIRKWVHYGFIPHNKLGRLVKFRKADIDEWLEQRHVSGRLEKNPGNSITLKTSGHSA